MLIKPSLLKILKDSILNGFYTHHFLNSKMFPEKMYKTHDQSAYIPVKCKFLSLTLTVNLI